jgi:hypothetical protein
MCMPNVAAKSKNNVGRNILGDKSSDSTSWVTPLVKAAGHCPATV